MSYSSDRNPTLPAVLRASSKDLQSQIYTSMPGKIVKFDASRKSANIQPVVQNEFINERGETVKETYPELSDVPIYYPEGGGNVVTFPLQEGDFVLLVFAQRSVDKYLSGRGNIEPPISLRMHHISDAFAFPGFGPYSERPSQPVDPDGIVIGRNDGTQIFIGDDCIGLNDKNAGDKASLDSKVQDELKAIRDSLNNLVTTFNGHTHVVAGVTPGMGSVTTATGLPQGTAPAPVQPANSDIVKLD